MPEDSDQEDQTGLNSCNALNSKDEPVSQSTSVSFDEKTSRKPRNLLIPSILVSLLCFSPFGFAAIWQATKSQRAVKRGEYETAKRHSNVAKSFIAFSIALGILQAVVMVTVVMLQLYVFPRYSYKYVEAIATTIHQ